MKKKLLIGLLVLLVLLIAPVAVIAADDTHSHDEITFDIMWDSVSMECNITTSSNIILMDNIEMTESLVISNNSTVNLCLNGKNLDMGSYNIKVERGATLNIYDCGTQGAIFSSSLSVDSTIYNLGTLYLNNGQIENNRSNSYTNLRYAIYNDDAVCIVNNGTIKSNQYGIYNKDSTCKINGGSITSKYDAIHNTDKSISVISNGVINSEKHVGIHNSDSTCTINGGTITGGYDGIWNNASICEMNGGQVVGSEYGVSNSNSAVFTMNGGNIAGIGWYGIYNDNSTCEINNGTITGKVSGVSNSNSSTCIIDGAETKIIGGNNGVGNGSSSCTINGGTIIAEGSYGEGVANSNEAICTINAGTIIGKNGTGVWNDVSTCIVNSGTIRGEKNDGIQNTNSICKIAGGIIFGEQKGVENSVSTTCTINGGTITGTERIGVYNGNSICTISGDETVIKGGLQGIQNNSSTCTITGGSISSEEQTTIVNHASSICIIGGGKISGIAYYIISNGDASKLYLYGSPLIENVEGKSYLYIDETSSIYATDVDGENLYSGKLLNVRAKTPFTGKIIVYNTTDISRFQYMNFYSDAVQYALAVGNNDNMNNLVLTVISSDNTSTGGGFSGNYNYAVNVADVEDVTVTFSKNYAVAGDTVTITVIPDSGKQVDEVIVTDADGDVITVTKVGDNQYSFVMTAGKVNVAVTTEAIDYDNKIVLQIGNQNVVVDGKDTRNDVAPVIQGDRTLVPIRVIVEALGGSADWNEATRIVTLTIDGKVLTLVIDEMIPGFGQGATIMDSRTYVPIRYVAEYIGANVEWIAETQQIVILK